jgi:hypothetical protein
VAELLRRVLEVVALRLDAICVDVDDVRAAVGHVAVAKLLVVKAADVRRLLVLVLVVEAPIFVLALLRAEVNERYGW